MGFNVIMHAVWGIGYVGVGGFGRVLGEFWASFGRGDLAPTAIIGEVISL